MILLLIITQFVLSSLGDKISPTVLPINYDIYIRIDKNFPQTNSFQGQVKITLNISESTQSISLHTKNLTDMMVRVSNDRTNFIVSGASRDSNSEILTINTVETLRPGFYFVGLYYFGVINSPQGYGLYKKTYKNSSYLSTKLGTKGARRIFPCFDKPGFKSTFNLAITVPINISVISSTAIDDIYSNNAYKTVIFKPTPVMSTSSFGFLVSTFSCDQVQQTITLKVCSRPETKNQRVYALSIGSKLLQYFENYTKTNYLNYLNRINMIAIDERGESAWAMPTFEEESLLLDTSSDLYKPQILKKVSEKLASLWFGNLVTPSNWTEDFLFAGLNKYFGYFAAHEVESRWKLDLQFVVEELQPALLKESLSVADFKKSKAASIIRMLVNLMGTDNFQLGIQQYLQMFKYENGNTENLLNHLQNYTKLSVPLVKILENWIYHNGYPLVTITRNGSDINISQEPFDVFKENLNISKWYIPITIKKFGVHGVERVTKILLLPTNKRSVTLKKFFVDDSEFVIANDLQFGYYRVTYDKLSWKKIGSLLQKNNKNIDVINRAQIIDNLFNVAKTGKVSHSLLFDTIRFLENDNEYFSWYSALNSVSIVQQALHNVNLKQKLTNYMEKLMKNVYQSVPFHQYVSDPMYAVKKELIVEWACKFNYFDCVENSRKAFLEFKQTLTLPKDLRTTIFCTGLKYSQTIEEDTQFLLRVYNQSEVASERLDILKSLGCISKKSIFKSILNLVSSIVPQHHRLEFFKSLVLNNPDGVNITLDLLNENFDIVNSDNIILEILSNVFIRKDQIQKVISLTKKKKTSQDLKKNIERIVFLATKNLQYSEILEKELEEYFEKNAIALESKSGSEAPSNNYIFTFALVFLYMFCS